MAVLQVTGPAVTVTAAVACVEERARALVEGSEGPLTLDQARADATLAALAGSPDLERVPSGRVGLTVDVLVPLDVLLGPSADSCPAELPGLGPLPDAVARAVARAARTVRVVPLDERGSVAVACVLPAREPDAPSDPDTGPDSHACAAVHPGSDTYRPGAAVLRRVRARDVTCRWPGCTVRAARCDVDHTVPFPEGSTRECNLACLCRLHHRTKHRAGWTVTQLPDGRLRLISPTGGVHVTDAGRWHRPRPPLPGRGATDRGDGDGDGYDDGPG